MNKRFRRLLYRSMDAHIDDKKRRRLQKALDESAAFRQEKTRSRRCAVPWPTRPTVPFPRSLPNRCSAGCKPSVFDRRLHLMRSKFVSGDWRS